TGTLTDIKNKKLGNKTIHITINDDEYEITTNNLGAYSLKVTANRTGTNTIKATYTGNDCYTNTTSYTVFNVNKQNTIITLSATNNTKLGHTIMITGILADKNNEKLDGKTVSIAINNYTYEATTNKNGTVTLTVTANRTGTNTIKATYTGDNSYTNTTSSVTINVNRLNTK
ncbi:MAG: hypothetical protein BZ138_03900, partial [Methanosphaera sp. rholeuAM270]